MNRLSKFLPKGARASASTSRALASSAGDSNLPPVVEGLYFMNNDPEHQATTFVFQTQGGRPDKEVIADTVRTAAKGLIYNRILDNEFVNKVSAEQMENLATSMLEVIHDGDKLTLEEKKEAVEMGVRQAFQMFQFVPKP